MRSLRVSHICGCDTFSALLQGFTNVEFAHVVCWGANFQSVVGGGKTRKKVWEHVSGLCLHHYGPPRCWSCVGQGSEFGAQFQGRAGESGTLATVVNLRAKWENTTEGHSGVWKQTFKRVDGTEPCVDLREVDLLVGTVTTAKNRQQHERVRPGPAGILSDDVLGPEMVSS